MYRDEQDWTSWLAFLHQSQVTDFILGPDRVFVVFSVPPGKHWGDTLWEATIASFFFLPNSSFTIIHRFKAYKLCS